MANKRKLYNLFLRGLTVGLRFLFVFFIGKKISLEMLGEYSLWTTTIAITVMFIGFDFYTHATRELLKVDKERQWALIRSQGWLIAISYGLLLPWLFLIFKFDVLDSQLMGWFFAVLIVEHLGSELYRLFNTLEKPILANVLLFVRSAIWMVLLYVLWQSGVEASMLSVLTYWFYGGVFALVLGVVVLLRMYRDVVRLPLDKKFISIGLRASFWLILGTLSLKTIELSDRYLIDHFLGKKELGAFSFFYQITNLINVVIYTVVIVMIYPQLFQALFHDKSKVSGLRKKMWMQAMAIFILLSLAVVVLAPFLIDWMQRPLLSERFSIIYPMLGAVLFFNIFLIYKLFLNAWNIDKQLLGIIFLGAILNFILNWWMIPRYGILAASVSSMVSYLLLAIGTYWTTQKEWLSRVGK